MLCTYCIYPSSATYLCRSKQEATIGTTQIQRWIYEGDYITFRYYSKMQGEDDSRFLFTTREKNILLEKETRLRKKKTQRCQCFVVFFQIR